ncbi:MAG: N-acetylmuramoyl-L-alanine amidase [Candidatus Poribacteria bacterium]|nr:N-acetylmuramoyl-L-alanine amidase [Candidatus Poribacteria bacterium]MDE0503880.1 N-acetylmuramoyl-L-alanine amidase [Candidatus Poribacteria bacterium]
MKIAGVFLFLFYVLTLPSCFRSADLTPVMYNNASIRHHGLTDRNVGGSDDEWTALIKEFEAIVNANPKGEWADDAQYAIGSCWIWLSHGTEPVRIQYAIDALEKLLDHYPDTPLVADAHYWLGACHFQLGDDNRATTHYQKVTNEYFNHSMSELAQFNLARIYEKQKNLAVAISMYQSVARRSNNTQLGTRAEEHIRSLRLGLTPESGESEREGIGSLGHNMPSLRRSLGRHIGELPAVSVMTAPPPKTDGEKVRTEGQSIPQIVLSDEVEIGSLPTTDIQLDVTAPTSKKRTTQAQNLERNDPAQHVLGENPPIDFGDNLTLPRQLALEVKTVVIDPGHGGRDPGATSKSQVHEKIVVLELSLMLRNLLVNRGYEVRLTRDTDIYLPLRERTQKATIQGADLFISIHANAAANTGASGVETYYLALASDETAQRTAARENSGAGYGIQELDTLVAKILKESKSEESRRLARYVQSELVNSTNAKDRGVKHAPFVVLIGTKVPAILVEVGFLSHRAEAHKLTKKAYKRNIAEAIANGIDRYVSSSTVTTAKGDGKTNE